MNLSPVGAALPRDFRSFDQPNPSRRKAAPTNWATTFRLIALCSVAVVLLSPAYAAETPPATSFSFDFGSGPAAPGKTRITAGADYRAETGFGFDRGTASAVTAGNGFVTSEQPFFFSVKVPEGNYRVTVTLGNPSTDSVATIKAESRRLMLEQLPIKAGESATRTFTVNVRDSHLPPPPLNAPGGNAVRLNDREAGVLHWDDKITFEFNGSHPSVRALELTRVDDAITVFLAGDSTVTDQPNEPGASWGQMLPRFFKADVAIANHAESGETMKSFITGLRLDKILSEVKPGDWLFIQFGHNDSKASRPQTYAEASTIYPAYLKVFIAEAKRRGVTPVLFSPVQRRGFDANGKIRNSHGDYPAAVRRVAEETGVTFIDLAAQSATFYEALGPEKSPLAFSNGGRDATHHDNYGAYEIAKCVVESLRTAKLDLAKHLIENLPPFDPAHPDAPETFALPASPGRSTQAPRGN